MRAFNKSTDKMRQCVLSLLLMSALSVGAQEKISINDQRSYNVSDIEKIEVIKVPKDVASVLEAQGEYSLFAEALEKTGLADSVCVWQTGKTFEMYDNHGRPGSGFAGSEYYYPTNLVKKYTLLAVDDNALKSYGIKDFASLKEKCVEWYGNANQWYTAPKISTVEDYTYTYNVVNMFVRYHILKCGIPASKLVNMRNASDENWNFAFGGEPYSYFETMLPHTMLKVWQPLYHNTGKSTNVWVNRYRANNTLTDEYWSYGSEGMHPIVDDGALLNMEKSDIKAVNGYIHNISKPLVYDRQVVEGVLNERMRVDVEDMVPELANNGMRSLSPFECAVLNREQNGVYDGTMCRIPYNYFENMKLSTEHVQMGVYSHGSWRAWNSQQFVLWNNWKGESAYIDIKLPPVPSDGEYEIRLPYCPMFAGIVFQTYLDGKKIGEPVDGRYPNTSLEEDRKATGYLLVDEFDDYGVESDKALRSNGYMRSPASFSRSGHNQVKVPASSPDDLIMNISNSCRYEEGYGTSLIRRVIGPVHLTQGEDHWLRIENTGGNVEGNTFTLDYIEIVPQSVYGNSTYTEDWY